MANNYKLPYLSEIIDLERDILPHRVVLLHVGVGVGKNTWTKILAKKGYRILLITSRRVTADVQAKNLDADQRIDIDRLFDLDDAWGRNCSRCTETGCVHQFRVHRPHRG